MKSIKTNRHRDTHTRIFSALNSIPYHTWEWHSFFFFFFHFFPFWSTAIVTVIIVIAMVKGDWNGANGRTRVKTIATMEKDLAFSDDMAVCVRNKLRKYRSEWALSLCDNQFRWNDDFIPNFSFSRFLSIRRSIVFFRCACTAHSVPRMWRRQHENQVMLLLEQAYSSPKTARRKKGSAALCTFVRNDEEPKNFIIIFRCEVYFFSLLLTILLFYTQLDSAPLNSLPGICDAHTATYSYMFPANVCKVYQKYDLSYQHVVTAIWSVDLIFVSFRSSLFSLLFCCWKQPDHDISKLPQLRDTAKKGVNSNWHDRYY